MFSNTIQQEELSKKRNDLIDELGNNLTPAQILYSTVDELENLKENNKSKQDIDNLTFKTNDDNKKIYKNEKDDEEELTPAEILYGKRKKEKEIKGVPTGAASNVNMTPVEELYKRNRKDTDNSNNYKDEKSEIKYDKIAKKTFKQKIIEKSVGKYYNPILNKYTKGNYGPDTAGMLDLSHGINMNDRNYIKDTISLNNYNDSRVAADREYLKKKISDQFKDYNFDINKIKGYFFKNNSEPSQRIAIDSDFKKIIKENKNRILSGQDISMEFPNYGLNKKSNLHYAYGHVDIRNGYLDKDGNLHIKMYDTYDFNKNNLTTLNQAGREQLSRGVLKPFFTVHDIIIPKDDLQKLGN